MRILPLVHQLLFRPGIGLAFLAAVGLTRAAAAVALAPVFTDQMVLQAHQPVVVWGESAPGETVRVRFAGQTKEATASGDGRWRVTLDPLGYMDDHRGQELEVQGRGNVVVVTDVRVGEVWLTVAPPALGRWAEDRVGPPGPQNLLWAGAGLPAATLERVRVWTSAGRWSPCTPEQAQSLGAAAYFFARHLESNLAVPIGLIDLTEDAASIVSYLPAHDLASAPPGPTAEIGRIYRERLAPLAPFAVRGVVWAPGAADLARRSSYQSWLTAMIARWRADFEQLNLPFLLAQLPGAAGVEGAAELRAAQDRVAGDVLDVEVAVAFDLGDCSGGVDGRAFELGERLGRLARARVYRETVPGVGAPGPGSVRIEDGEVLVDFNQVGGGLVLTDAELRHFELLDGEHAPVAARARLAGPRTVAVEIPAGLRPTGVRYGWADCFAPTLRDAHGLPAVPFVRRFDSPTNLDPERWASTIAAFVQQDRLRMPPTDGVLFIGSSSIRGWQTLARDFPDRPTINRGFGGSLASDSVYYFDRIVQPYRPRTIVFYAGENDVAVGRSPAEVAEAFATFCEQTHEALPETEILFLALKPSPSRWHLWPAMAETNRRIADYCGRDARRTFIDTAAPLLDAQGRVRTEYFLDDALHLNRSGYAAWVRTLRPRL